MKKILFATGNVSKAKRFSKGLLEKGIEILSLKDVDMNLDVLENGKDAIENAIIKAKAYYEKTNMAVMGMDDTLYMENVPLDKQPGLFVRRVGGKELTDEEMIEYYSNLVKTYGVEGKINCKWIYGLAVINEKGEIHTYTWSKDDFYMVENPFSVIRSGYPLSSLSKYKKIDKYFDEATEEEKRFMQVNENHVVNFIAEHI